MNVILNSEYRNWILGAVIKESSQFTNRKVSIKFVTNSRRKNPINFLYRKYLNRLRFKSDDLIVNQKCLLFLINSKLINPDQLAFLRCHYTHDTEDFLISSGLIVWMKQLKQILVLNLTDAAFLTHLGIDRQRILVIYGAIDRNIFFPSQTFIQNREVFVSGDAKERKNPTKVLEVINSTPHMTFVICGRFWQEFINSCEIKHSNVVCHEFSLERTAYLIRRASVYLTLSRQEGGPFPVLEALASGTPVVSTPVGWTPELITSQNGLIVRQDSSIFEIQDALEKGLKLKESTWKNDLLHGQFTWKELASKLYDPATFPRNTENL